MSKKVRPIKIQGNALNGSILLIGGLSPYLFVEAYNTAGYISDRDILKLRNWCNACLRPAAKARRKK